ncbi:protein VASCULAR ASSOCIATED DEATH 1, chloroplastic isoform X1 [Populus alba]|uniref:protein VASCULAR ASSOCIATED DEATH 1, chloroplastic isoform X1 n=1 Tax=Populus alba TaxID=43335 RepID=UPI00158B6448|nr:protein VASCULAR ASSOCIATED DEATH 1, chloroplastic-like isoform X1 [Populus alba]
MAAVASASGGERPDTSPAMDVLSSKSATDAASDSSSSSFATETPDLNDHSNISPSPSREVDPHSQASARSEEYRQLFRLPTEEVLIQDFNCAYQESILLQGHMYLFVHHICFYSNIFGFETKKIIPFNEITDVKRAKTAGIFPNAIEICAGGKKYFFASFLSRDEALKLIIDGWLQHGNGSNLITEQQDSISVTSNPDNGLVVTEKVNNFKQVSELDPPDRQMAAAPSPDSKISASIENGTVSITQILVADEVEQDVDLVINTDSFSSTTLAWNVENFEAPQRRESFKEVGETKFLIKVEEFFHLFFSDDAASFVESFHSRCGDKEFRCSLWYPNEEFGHARDVSFQHPIKIYFGAKFGSCQEVQKFRVYRNSNLVIETSQQISDVPFGDCFCVEGLWDVTRDGDGSNEGCILRIYVDVVFSKKVIFKGKIVQSTVEECREAYAIWINMAHELLKQKNLEKQAEAGPTLSMIHEEEIHSEREVEPGEASENSYKPRGHVRMQQTSSSVAVSQQADDLVQGNFTNATSITSSLGEYATKLFSFSKSQSQISLVLVIAFIVIILMQVSILVLLNRPQTVHVASPEYNMGGLRAGAGENSAEAVAWLERRTHHLKDEMFMVEAKLERLQQEHSWLKSQLKNLDNLEKHK